MPIPDRVVVAVRAVSASRGGTRVLTGIDLELLRGELVTVVGPSGAGKSTLLSLMAGLAEPDAGEIVRPEAAGGSTRIVFQAPHLLPWRTVTENVRLGLEYRANHDPRPASRRERLRAADERVGRLLDELGIGTLAGRLPHELSGGQAQRVAIARAVAADPTLLLLDEPFSALDPLTRADMQHWLRRVHDARGLTTVLVTHDLAEAVALGDRVALLRPATAGLEIIDRAGATDAEADLLARLKTQIPADAASSPQDPDTRTTAGTRRGADRREFLTVAGAAALLALPVAAGLATRPRSAQAASHTAAATPAAAKRDTVRIGYLPITDAAALLIAHDAGEFATRGIDTPAPTLFRGWAPLVEALQAGSVDVVHLLMPLAMQLRYDAKVPVKVLAWNHVNGSAVTVATHVQRIEDLAGTTFAVPGWYSIHNVVFQQMLRHAGLHAVIDQTPTRAASTVQLVVMAPADMPTALRNGSVSGYIVAEPFCAVAEVQDIGRILRFTGDVWREHACCVTVVREQLLTDDPDLAQRIADAVVAAQRRILHDRSGAARRLSDGGYLPQAPEAIRRVLIEHDEKAYIADDAIEHPQWHQPRIGFQPYAYPSYTEALVTAMRQTVFDADTSWLGRLDPAAVHTDLVSTAVNDRAITAAGGLAVFGAHKTRTEQVQP